MLASCASDSEEDGKYGSLFMRSYVQVYCDGSFTIRSETSPSRILNIRRDQGNQYMHYSPEWVEKTLAAEQETRNFMEFATRNNDLFFNQLELWTSFNVAKCSADNFKEVRVVCPDVAWGDGKHPAGSSLNDVAYFHTRSYAKFVRNGYTGNRFEDISKPVSELTEEDLAMISPGMAITFVRYPKTVDRCRIEVTFVTTDDEEMTVAGTINPQTEY